MKLIDITGKAISGEWGNDCEDGNGIPVLRTTNFTDTGVINFANVVLRDIPTKDLSKKFLRPGDIIIEKSGGSDTKPVGRVVYFDSEENKYLINNFTGLLRVVDQTKWYPRYVFYALFANYSFGGTRQYENKTTGLHNLKLDQYLNSFDIPDVDFQLQHHIADTLDKVSEGIEVCRKMLGELDLMVKAKFGEMFGALGEDKFNWGMTTLGVCCELNPKRPRDIPDDMDVSFVAMPSVTEKGQIDTSVIKPYLEVRKGFTYFAENDVLFAKITPCMENGKGCVAKGLTNAIGAGSTEFHVLRPIHGKSNPYWLYYLTVIPGFRENARKVMTGTGGQLRVPIAYLDNLPVSLPPIELQEQFATFVSKIDKSRLTIQQVLSKMEMVKLALMQEYFG